MPRLMISCTNVHHIMVMSKQSRLQDVAVCQTRSGSAWAPLTVASPVANWQCRSTGSIEAWGSYATLPEAVMTSAVSWGPAAAYHTQGL